MSCTLAPQVPACVLLLFLKWTNILAECLPACFCVGKDKLLSLPDFNDVIVCQ